MPSKNILIVEDDHDVADVIADAMTSETHVCRVAGDGRQALRLIAEHVPDLIILDRGLPEYSGDDILRAMKRDAALSSIPVIMLTGKADEADQLVGFALGADDYVCKPFSTKLLSARVETLLRRMQTPPETIPAISAPAPATPITLDKMQFAACVGEQTVTLSRIEYELLATLMAARGHVLDTRTLLGSTSNVERRGSGQSIETHIAALQKKLGPASGYIQEIRGAGYAYCAPGAATFGQ